MVHATDNDRAGQARPGPGARKSPLASEGRIEDALDLLALATIWLVVVPPHDVGGPGPARTAFWAGRVAISVVYGIYLVARMWRGPTRLRYLVTHPVLIASVALPALRAVFSVRYFRTVFRRGNLPQFLVTAILLVLNGAVVACFYERHAPGANIHTIGQSLWWSAVTVTGVGYGDYFPVTVVGKLVAVGLMITGIVTLAVITATVAASFLAQAGKGAPKPDNAAVMPAAASERPAAASERPAAASERPAAAAVVMPALASVSGASAAEAAGATTLPLESRLSDLEALLSQAVATAAGLRQALGDGQTGR